MEIVLFRHGVAESYSLLGDDERELTSEGVKKVKQSAKGLRRLLINRKRVMIYSSPLQRARQTADLLTTELKASDRFLRDEIVEGRFEELYCEWTRYDDDATVVVVGHEPTLGMWLERATGERLSMDKGAACAITTRDLLRKAKGKMLWYLTDEALIRMAPKKD